MLNYPNIAPSIKNLIEFWESLESYLVAFEQALPRSVFGSQTNYQQVEPELKQELEQKLQSYVRQGAYWQEEPEMANWLLSEKLAKYHVGEAWARNDKAVPVLSLQHLQYLMHFLLHTEGLESKNPAWAKRADLDIRPVFDRLKSGQKIFENRSEISRAWDELYVIYEVSTRSELVQKIFSSDIRKTINFEPSSWLLSPEADWNSWSDLAKKQAVYFLAQYLQMNSLSYFTQVFPQRIPEADLEIFLQESALAFRVPQPMYDDILSEEETTYILAFGRAMAHGLGCQPELLVESTRKVRKPALSNLFWSFKETLRLAIQQYDYTHYIYQNIPALIQVSELKLNISDQQNVLRLTVRGVPVADSLAIGPKVSPRLWGYLCDQRNVFLSLLEPMYGVEHTYLDPQDFHLFIPSLLAIAEHKDPYDSLDALSLTIRISAQFDMKKNLKPDPHKVARLDPSIWPLLKVCHQCDPAPWPLHPTNIGARDSEHCQHDLYLFSQLLQIGVDFNFLHPWLYSEFDRRRRYHYQVRVTQEERKSDYHQTIYGMYLESLWQLLGPNYRLGGIMDYLESKYLPGFEVDPSQEGSGLVTTPVLHLDQVPLLYGCSLENLHALTWLLDRGYVANLYHLPTLKLPVLTYVYCLVKNLDRAAIDSVFNLQPLLFPDRNKLGCRDNLKEFLGLIETTIIAKIEGIEINPKLIENQIAVLSTLDHLTLLKKASTLLQLLSMGDQLNFASQLFEYYSTGKSETIPQTLVLVRLGLDEYAYSGTATSPMIRRAIPGGLRDLMADVLADILAQCLWPQLSVYCARNVLKTLRQIHLKKSKDRSTTNRLYAWKGDVKYIDLARSLPGKALKQVFDLLENSPLVKGYVREVLRLILTFGSNYKPWLEAVIQSNLAQKLGNRLHTGLIVLPTQPEEDLPPFLIKYKNTLLTKNNYSMLQAIISKWAELSSEIKAQAPRDIYREILSHSYPGARNLDLALEAAKAGIRVGTYRKLEQRWLNSLDQPSFIPIPPIMMDGYRGYFLERSDPRGLFLGIYTNCCQHPGGVGSAAAWYGQEKANAGFFVVENAQGEIIAQSVVWEQALYGDIFKAARYVAMDANTPKEKIEAITSRQGLVFDNVESKGLSPERNRIVAEIYEQAAKRLLRAAAGPEGMDKYYTINLGLDYGKLRYRKWRTAKINLAVPPDLNYSDANHQVAIVQRKGIITKQ